MSTPAGGRDHRQGRWFSWRATILGLPGRGEATDGDAMARIGTTGWLLGALLMGGMPDGQAASPAALTTADYERAARMLGDRTAPLVDGLVANSTWLDDGTAVYAYAEGGKTAWRRLDPATGASVAAFDAKALAEAINQAAGGKGRPVQPDRLPVAGIRLQDGALVVSTRRRPTMRARPSSATGTCGCATSPPARKPS
jgi:hypothetical protein